MELHRFTDWPQRLAHAIEARKRSPYEWGRNDCALFAADLIAAVTGQDFAAPFRGKYQDEAGAKAMLETHGWRDLEAMVDELLPRRRLELGERPRRGDAVLVDGRFGPFLGIVWQGGVIGPGPDKMAFWPSQTFLAAWSVG